MISHKEIGIAKKTKTPPITKAFECFGGSFLVASTTHNGNVMHTAIK